MNIGKHSNPIDKVNVHTNRYLISIYLKMSRLYDNLSLVSNFNENAPVDGYLNLESTLADNQAINIVASDPAGGINIDAGFGGITIDTTNGISLDAGAESNFTTTVGNLVFNAAGLANIDGTGGINIGTNPYGQTVNVGTSSSSQTLNIGNMFGSTVLNLQGGTGGILADANGPISLDANGTSSNFSLTTTGDGQDLTIALLGSTDSSLILTSSGTAADALRLFSAGGLDVDVTGLINFATASALGGAITLDASFGGGGITLSSGSQGIAINANGGLIGIGHWSGGDMSIGTAAVQRIITIGNITGTTSLTLNSGSGGINIGGNLSTGEVHIANTTVAKSVYVGNTTGGSRVFTRRGSGGFIRSQPAHTSLGDASVSLTVANILTEILSGTPTVDRTLTLPDASSVVSTISGLIVDDALDFYLINESVVDDAEWILAMGTGGTMIGNPNVSPRENTINTYKNSGSAKFRLRMTNVTASSEAYTVYRLS